MRRIPWNMVQPDDWCLVASVIAHPNCPDRTREESEFSSDESI